MHSCEVFPTREGFVEDVTFLRTNEGCIFVKVLPIREGFVEDATFLRTSDIHCSYQYLKQSHSLPYAL